jgi:hypothetical protein
LSKPLNQTSSDAAAAVLGSNEDLPHVNEIAFATKQGVSDDRSLVFDNGGLVVRSQPFRHSLDELRDRHRVSVSLIVDELSVERAQSLSVLDRYESNLHGAHQSLKVSFAAPLPGIQIPFARVGAAGPLMSC